MGRRKRAHFSYLCRNVFRPLFPLAGGQNIWSEKCVPESLRHRRCSYRQGRIESLKEALRLLISALRTIALDANERTATYSLHQPEADVLAPVPHAADRGVWTRLNAALAVKTSAALLCWAKVRPANEERKIMGYLSLPVHRQPVASSARATTVTCHADSDRDKAQRTESEGKKRKKDQERKRNQRIDDKTGDKRERVQEHPCRLVKVNLRKFTGPDFHKFIMLFLLFRFFQ